MKTFTRVQLLVMAAAVFAAHKVSSLFATSDGQFFIHEDRAKLHARGNNPSLRIFEIDAEEVPAEKAASTTPPAAKPKGKVVKLPTSKILKLSVKKIKPALKEIETAEAIGLLIKEETDTQNRTGVIAALEARLDEINAVPETPETPETPESYNN